MTDLTAPEEASTADALGNDLGPNWLQWILASVCIGTAICAMVFQSPLQAQAEAEASAIAQCQEDLDLMWATPDRAAKQAAKCASLKADYLARYQ